MHNVKTLFVEKDLYALLKHWDQRLKERIESFSEDVILGTGVDILVERLKEDFSIEVPTLHEDQIYVSDRETTIERYSPMDWGVNLKAVEVTFHVPYTGDSNMFDFQANEFSTRMPRAIVSPNELLIQVKSTDNDGEKIKIEFNQNLNDIRRYLSLIKNQVDPHLARLPEIATRQITDRKEKILKNKGMVASLGFPLKKRPDAPSTYIAPSVKRKVTTRATTQSVKPFSPEPILSDEDYAHILSVISNMVLVMERSPAAFTSMKEEDLRQHFLVQLNGQYQGNATGETFNYEGKTDILIREQGKNIFIAECKFWQGETILTETIDQILKYTSWRDTKTAILLFSRNKDFTSVLDQILPIVQKHGNFIRFVERKNETEFKFVLRHKDDSARELALTILAFNIPTSK